MISFLCEEVSDDFAALLYKVEKYHIVALTPKACFQLDMLQYEYNIPDDYVFPEEVPMETIKEINEECGIARSLSIVFLSTVRAVNYWKLFLSVYSNKLRPDKIVKIGNQYRYLSRLLTK